MSFSRLLERDWSARQTELNLLRANLFKLWNREPARNEVLRQLCRAAGQ
jgi:hypothetical protein